MEHNDDNVEMRERPVTDNDNAQQQPNPDVRTDGSNRPEADGAGTEKIPIYLDPATEQGLSELLEKLAPLIQGRRLHNIVDLLSLVSDVIDLSDEAMINKLMAGYEQAIGGVWATGNAARYAANETTQSQTPTVFGLLRTARDEDVRRGLYFLLQMAGVFGRQMRPDPE